MQKIVFFITLLVFHSNAFSQYIIKLGATSSGIYNKNNLWDSYHNRYAATSGFGIIKKCKELPVIYLIEYTQKGHWFETSYSIPSGDNYETYYKLKLNYIQASVSPQFSVGNLRFSGGCYIAYTVFPKEFASNKTNGIIIGQYSTNPTDNQFRKLDIGISLAAKYFFSIRNHNYFVEFQTQSGLRNIIRNTATSNGNYSTNFLFGVSTGIFLNP